MPVPFVLHFPFLQRLLHLLPRSLTQGCWSGRSPLPHTQSSMGLFLGGKKKGAFQVISKFGKTSYFGASAPPAFSCINPSNFPILPSIDTLSVPRWSPQIPRRDLGNSIKHRYAGWGQPVGTPELSLSHPCSPGTCSSLSTACWM